MPTNKSLEQRLYPRPMHDLNAQGAKKKEQADRNKMKTYGDEFDPRPRGRIYTPEMMPPKKPRSMI